MTTKVPETYTLVLFRDSDDEIIDFHRFMHGDALVGPLRGRVLAPHFREEIARMLREMNGCVGFGSGKKLGITPLTADKPAKTPKTKQDHIDDAILTRKRHLRQERPNLKIVRREDDDDSVHTDDGSDGSAAH